MSKHQEFFSMRKGYAVQLVGPYGPVTRVSVEDLFQAFKARLIDEVVCELRTETVVETDGAPLYSPQVTKPLVEASK